MDVLLLTRDILQFEIFDNSRAGRTCSVIAETVDDNCANLVDMLAISVYN